MAMLAALVTALSASAATFSCGPNCEATVEPWCADGLRVRMYAKGGKPLDAAGALTANARCGGEAERSARALPSGLSNGAITASWAGGALSFSRTSAAESSDTGVAAPFLASDGAMASAFAIGPPLAPPPPGPPPPKPFYCQDTCSLGATGVKEKTDAKDCVSAGKLVNVTQSACCAACGANKTCVAWAWGRDGADTGHRHNCYMCAGLSGTAASSERDFGCVVRSADGTPPPPPPPPTHRTNFTYHSTSANFGSTADEVIVGLGQRSNVGNCSTGKGCGQWKLNQKGFTWPLGMTKYQITVPWYVSSRRYGFLWNAPGGGSVDVQDTATRWNNTHQRQIDFWVVAPAAAEGDPYGALMSRYADATGHAPLLPADRMGFWQSKMRYRSSDELADIALAFASRQIPLDVLVIDFYSWTKFGDLCVGARCCCRCSCCR